MEYITVNLCGGPRDGEIREVDSRLYPHGKMRFASPTFNPSWTTNVIDHELKLPEFVTYEFSKYHTIRNVYYTGPLD